MLKVKTEKIVKNSKKYRRILSIEGAPQKEQLPEGYIHKVYNYGEKQLPCFYAETRYENWEKRKGIMLYYSVDLNPNSPYGSIDSSHFLYEGEEIEEEGFLFYLTKLHEAIKRLHEMNLKEQWKGLEEFSFEEGELYILERD